MFVGHMPELSREELLRVCKRNRYRATLAILRVYGLLIFIIGAAIALGGWWLIPAIILIGGLQHAVSILQHEAVHGLLYRSRKVNDFIGAFLLSYPIGFTMKYRAQHFAHHRDLGAESDPDRSNYLPFPAHPKRLIKKVLLDFSGYSSITQVLRGESGGGSGLIWAFVAQILVFGIFVSVGAPYHYFYLWLLPLLTVTKGFAQIRNMAEHLHREDVRGPTERVRTFKSSVLERYFLAPLNFHYHAEHHWYPMVPYYNLPELRRILQKHPEFTHYTEVAPNYLSVIRRAAKSV